MSTTEPERSSVEPTAEASATVAPPAPHIGEVPPTELLPRPRRVATQPGRPVQVEHEYRRAGATHLFTAFDTRSGRVYGVTTRRKRLRSPSFPDLAALQRAIHQFIAEWNEIAHPFRWTAASFEKILARIDAALTANPPRLADAA